MAKDICKREFDTPELIVSNAYNKLQRSSEEISKHTSSLKEANQSLDENEKKLKEALSKMREYAEKYGKTICDRDIAKMKLTTHREKSATTGIEEKMIFVSQAVFDLMGRTSAECDRRASIVTDYESKMHSLKTKFLEFRDACVLTREEGDQANGENTWNEVMVLEEHDSAQQTHLMAEVEMALDVFKEAAEQKSKNGG